MNNKGEICRLVDTAEIFNEFLVLISRLVVVVVNCAQKL